MDKQQNIKNNDTDTQKNKQQKNTSWIRNIAIGLVLFISGILEKFFPSTVMTVSYMVLGVIFALIGISDIVAALKYKKSGADHKLILGMGGLSLVTALYFIPATIYLYEVRISLYITSAWLIARGALNTFGKVKGSLKRKNVMLWAFLMMAAGLFIAVFCEKIVSYSISYLAYILIGAGTLLVFFGIYQKTDEKESREKKIREEEIQKGLPEALEAAKRNPELPDGNDQQDVTSENKTANNQIKDLPSEPVITTEQTPEETVEAEIVESTPKQEETTKKKGFFGSFLKK
ncbi:MAG: hypothetical protein E7218_02260 [Anaerofustis stercorihominis]|nr:hypothetical protein [Anaerofustis stercorihominis]